MQKRIKKTNKVLLTHATLEVELKKFENKYNKLIKNLRTKEKTQGLENFQNFINNKKIEYSNIDIILENKTLIDLKKDEVLKVINRFNKRLEIEEIRISKNADNNTIENTLNTLNTINTRLFLNLSRIENEIKNADITDE